MKEVDYWKEVFVTWLMKDRPQMGMPAAITNVAMYVSLTVITLALIHAVGNISPVCP